MSVFILLRVGRLWTLLDIIIRASENFRHVSTASRYRFVQQITQSLTDHLYPTMHLM